MTAPTCSIPGRRRRRSTRSPSPAVRASGSGTTTGSDTSTSARSSINTNLGHQHPKHRAGDQGSGRPAVHGRAAARRTRRAREAARLIAERRRPTWTACSSPTAAPRRTRTPSAWPDLHTGPPEDDGHLPLLSRGDRPRDRRDRRPSPLASTRRRSPASCTSRSLHVPVVVPLDDRSGGVPTARSSISKRS